MTISGLRRMAANLLRAAPWVLLAYLALLYSDLWEKTGLLRGDLASLAAEQRFYEHLIKIGDCRRINDLEQAAAHFGWRVERRHAPYGHSQLSDDLPVALLVYVEPAVPFGSDWIAYHFDAAECLSLK